MDTRCEVGDTTLVNKLATLVSKLADAEEW
jgi:hypothetical protein